jgi:hypothetical protein
MLRAIELHGETSVHIQQIDFQRSETIERNRQVDVDANAALGFRQRFEPPVEKRFSRTARSICAVGV